MIRYRVEGTTAVYHCIMRTAGGLRVLEAGDKEALRKMLWKVADFSGVTVLAYCIMSNHFHVLVRVPERDDAAVGRKELARRYRALYAQSNAPGYPDADVMESVLKGDDEEAAAWEARLRARMEDVSAFMKTLNQRFSVWYNKTHGRFGTLWAARFKSVIVENDPTSLKTVAAYIDLNPVRAGIVDDPSDYRWSTYGEAMGGMHAAQAGLSAVVAQTIWDEASLDYRMVLYGKGANGRVGEQHVIPRERVLEVLASGGKVPLADLLRCRVRFLTEGAVLGSAQFVSETARDLQAREGKRRTAVSKRKSRTKVLPVADASELVSLRNLRKSPIS